MYIPYSYTIFTNHIISTRISGTFKAHTSQPLLKSKVTNQMAPISISISIWRVEGTPLPYLIRKHTGVQEVGTQLCIQTRKKTRDAHPHPPSSSHLANTQSAANIPRHHLVWSHSNQTTPVSIQPPPVHT